MIKKRKQILLPFPAENVNVYFTPEWRAAVAGLLPHIPAPASLPDFFLPKKKGMNDISLIPFLLRGEKNEDLEIMAFHTLIAFFKMCFMQFTSIP